MTWHLLGAGAMGSLAAFHLGAAGWPVEVPGREPGRLLRQLAFAPAQDATQLTLPVTIPARITRLLLATKAQQTAAALAPWLPRLAADVTLVCLQNGMGQLDGVALPPQARVVTAITTSGAWRAGETVQVVAENSTFMGDGGAAPPDWFAALAKVWPQLQWVADIRRRQLEKLAVNAVINPLTAIHDCCNGELLSAEREAELQALAAEVDDVLAAVEPGWPCDTLRRSRQVAQLTAGNVSSMLADVRAGRPTEIAFINGWLVRQAERCALAVPRNRALLARLA